MLRDLYKPQRPTESELKVAAAACSFFPEASHRMAFMLEAMGRRGRYVLDQYMELRDMEGAQ